MKIISKYDLTLDGEWNIEKLPHIGRHPNEYHDWILKRMIDIDIKSQYNKELFLKYFELDIKQPVMSNPEMLNKRFWR